MEIDKPGRFTLSQDGDRYILVTYLSRISSRINKVLDRYPRGTVFLDTDEPVFFVPPHRMIHVRAVLGIK